MNGLYSARPPTTSFAGINLAASIVSLQHINGNSIDKRQFDAFIYRIAVYVSLQHPLSNCRLYYSQVTVDPQKSIDYAQQNRNKKVIYRSFVTNSYKL